MMHRRGKMGVVPTSNAMTLLRHADLPPFFFQFQPKLAETNRNLLKPTDIGRNLPKLAKIMAEIHVKNKN